MAPRLLSLLLALTLFAVDAEARRRAVRAASTDCVYALSSTMSDPIPATGVNRGVVNVTPAVAGCSLWAAFSSAPWVTIETDATTAYVTVTANSTSESRSTVLLIAGASLPISQSGSSAVSPPTPGNLLLNGGFDTSLQHWGWQSRFPNSSGDTAWSSLDANGSTSSGSIHIRDLVSGDAAYQQSQCVAAQPGYYDYGFSVLLNDPAGVRGVIALVEFDSTDCSGSFYRYSPKTFTPSSAGVWQNKAYTGSLRSSGRSILIVIGAYATESGVREVWIDNVFLRPR